MQTTEDMTPIAPDETEFLSIDFSTYLASGDSVASIEAWNCTVADKSNAADANPSAHLIGAPAANGNIVVQEVSGCIKGVTYVMEALVITQRGEHLSLWSFIECKAVGTSTQ